MSEMFFLFLQLYFFNCLQSTLIKCLLNFYYWTPQLPVGGGVQLFNRFVRQNKMLQ